ncbi:MAG: hypothetical protein AAB632_02720 [Patescibacteria group bacterium]|mgnify:CR=1 FL=1
MMSNEGFKFKITSLKNEEQTNIKEKEKNMKVNQGLIKGGFIVLVILILGYLFVMKPDLSLTKKQESSNSKVNVAETINEKSWYAVFFSNGQVYFGHLKDVSGQFVTLGEIYYLQLDKPLQSTNPKDKLKEADEQTKLQLIKLGKELHGPKDEMTINRDHILFYEELNSDSKVVQSIEKYKKEQKKD